MCFILMINALILQVHTTPVALVVGAALTWLLQIFDDDDFAVILRILGNASVHARPR